MRFMGIGIRSDAEYWEEDEHPRLNGWAKNLTAGQECFYCEDVIDSIGLYWSGPYDLWLHPSCFLRLTMRLMRDAQAIDKARPPTPLKWVDP